MANTITKTTLIDGPRNLVVLVNITGDGSGQETNTVVVSRAGFTPTGTELVVTKIISIYSNFTSILSFDATTDLILAHQPSGWSEIEFDNFGGVSSNKSGAGAIGDILITTTGLLATGKGTILLEMKKS